MWVREARFQGALGPRAGRHAGIVCCRGRLGGGELLVVHGAEPGTMASPNPKTLGPLLLGM